MTNATVKWFNNDLGFGFAITIDGLELFIHYSQIDMNGYKTLNKGQNILIDLYERYDHNVNMIGYEGKNIKIEE